MCIVKRKNQRLLFGYTVGNFKRTYRTIHIYTVTPREITLTTRTGQAVTSTHTHEGGAAACRSADPILHKAGSGSDPR